MDEIKRAKASMLKMMSWMFMVSLPFCGARHCAMDEAPEADRFGTGIKAAGLCAALRGSCTQVADQGSRSPWILCAVGYSSEKPERLTRLTEREARA
jgi:hypothetical protein